MRVVAIIQARMTSTRLPGKVLADIAGRPMLAHVVGRARRAKRIAETVVATTDKPTDDPVAALCRREGVPVFRGSEHDVLDRYHGAAKAHHAEVVVRLTADCPLLDPEVIDEVVGAFRLDEHDYVSNIEPATFPDGLDTEVFSFAALDRAWREAALTSEREHVTPYIRKHPELFRHGAVRNDRDLSHLRWTVDEPQDLAFARVVLERTGDEVIGFRDLAALVEREPALGRINAGLVRNEGYLKSLREDRPFQR